MRARAPAILLGDPIGANPTPLFHPVQRRVERTFLGAQHVDRDLLDGCHDRVPVKAGPAGENLEHQQIE